MPEEIKDIVRDGVCAPSGENCQPWKFLYKNNILSIFNIEEADKSLYNIKQRGSYIAHGALIENIFLSALERGYNPVVTLLPDNSNLSHTADIFFQKQNSQKDTLYNFIRTRCTNRKDYKKEKLNEKEKIDILNSVTSYEKGSLVFVDDPILMKDVGYALSAHEKVLFETKSMHDFFYKHIIWRKEDENKSGGFFIDTLEFLPHQLGAVKLFKNWNILKVFNFFLKIADKISKENGEKYTNSAAFCALTMKGFSAVDFLHLGRAVQRSWLMATKLGLAVHPCNGTLYLHQFCKNGGDTIFNTEHLNLINKSFHVLENSFNTNGAHIGFIFRVGKAEKPTAVSKRMEPVFIN